MLPMQTGDSMNDLAAIREMAKRQPHDFDTVMRLACAVPTLLDCIDAFSAALRAVEWAIVPSDEAEAAFPVCLTCRQLKANGHAPDCIVGLALKNS